MNMKSNIVDKVFQSEQEAKDYGNNIQQWRDDGSPHIWFTVETKELNSKVLTAQVDIGYGLLRLLVNCIEVGRSGQHVVESDDAVVLDKEYYGVHKYIWI